MPSVLVKALSDARSSLLGWMIGIGLLTAMYAAYFPSMRKPAMTEAMESYPEALKEAFNLHDMSTGAGYLQGTVFGLLVPLVVVIFTISVGARITATDEENGTLDLLLSYPISRARLVLERCGAMLVSTLAVSLIVLLMLVVVSEPADLGVAVDKLAGMTLHLAMLGLCFGALAMAVGCLAGRRSMVLAAAGAIAVVGYLGDSFAPQIENLQWMQHLSPFFYYDDGSPLKEGVQWANVGVLAAVTVVFLAAGTVAFQRRDVAV
ncbi:MAG: ABC transporter permease subunit [Micromonosporaceae bacterium]|nr:ABC transporter permease subunit [Micromonosporaceae bacterium]